jgi:hypothetical protein
LDLLRDGVHEEVDERSGHDCGGLRAQGGECSAFLASNEMGGGGVERT